MRKEGKGREKGEKRKLKLERMEEELGDNR